MNSKTLLQGTYWCFSRQGELHNCWQPRSWAILMEFMPYKVGQLWDAVVEAIVEEIFVWGKKKASSSHQFVDFNENQACHSQPLMTPLPTDTCSFTFYWQPAGLQSELTPSETSLMHEQYTQTTNQHEDFICLAMHFQYSISSWYLPLTKC